MDRSNNSWEVAKNDHHPSTAQEWWRKSKILSPPRLLSSKIYGNREKTATKPPIKSVNLLAGRIGWKYIYIFLMSLTLFNYFRTQDFCFFLKQVKENRQQFLLWDSTGLQILSTSYSLFFFFFLACFQDLSLTQICERHVLFCMHKRSISSAIYSI